mmetsp:Transcript_60307/g.191585  ORF Transcript_60307/g.191585 Transcript_60307/m.191585 type:complete len:216 (+) Transcript_60307:277-924(+)
MPARSARPQPGGGGETRRRPRQPRPLRTPRPRSGARRRGRRRLEGAGGLMNATIWRRFTSTWDDTPCTRALTLSPRPPAPGARAGARPAAAPARAPAQPNDESSPREFRTSSLSMLTTSTETEGCPGSVGRVILATRRHGPAPPPSESAPPAPFPGTPEGPGARGEAGRRPSIGSQSKVPPPPAASSFSHHDPPVPPAAWAGRALRSSARSAPEE